MKPLLAATATEASDEQLVMAAREGSDVAFEALFRRYRDRVVGYVRGMVSDHGRAEDIVQEAFMSALRSLRSSDQEIAFRPWIYEIAKNACIDHLRRERRAQEVSIDSDDFGPQEEGRLSRDLGSTDAAVARRGQLESLRMAFHDLPDSQHQILVMRELEGLSYDKIGNRMGLTNGAVESLLFRARRRLRDEFDEIDTGARCMSMRSAMEAVAEGTSRARERRRLSIHLRDCKPCRRHAVAMGLDSLALGAEQAQGRLHRAILSLPLPAFLRRRLDDAATLGPAAHAGAEQGATLAGKATAVVVAAVLAAGGAGVTHKATGGDLPGVGDLPVVGGSAPAAGEDGSGGGSRSAPGGPDGGGPGGVNGTGATPGSPSSPGGPGAAAGGGSAGEGAAGRPGAAGGLPLTGQDRKDLPGALGGAVGGTTGEAGRGTQDLQGVVGEVGKTVESVGSGVGVSPGRTIDNVQRGDVDGIVNDVGNTVRELPGRVLPGGGGGGGSGSNPPQSGSGSGPVSVPEVRLPAPSVQLPRVGGTAVPGTGLKVPDTGLGL